MLTTSLEKTLRRLLPDFYLPICCNRKFPTTLRILIINILKFVGNLFYTNILYISLSTAYINNIRFGK